MTHDGTCATGSRCSTSLGKLVWVVVPVAAVVVFMFIRGDHPPANSVDVQTIQEKAPKLAEDMDRYAQPTEPAQAKSDLAPTKSDPAPGQPEKPPADVPAKPPEPQ